MKVLEERMESASVQDKMRFENVRELLGRLSDIKITDPLVLLKLYKMYAYTLKKE